MIATDRYAYISAPNTGESYLARVLFRIHHRPGGLERMKEAARALLGRTRFSHPSPGRMVRNRYGEFRYQKEVLLCSDIATPELARPIIGTIRNPYEWYVSDYLGKHWHHSRDRFSLHVPDFEGRYPDFPELSFLDFVQLLNDWFHTYPGHGRHVHVFAKYYFRDGEALKGRIDDGEYWESGAYRADLCPFRFLHFERLGLELYDLLLDSGYDENGLLPIRLASARPSAGTRVDWATYYTPELQAFVRERERILFTLFPEYDAWPPATALSHTPHEGRELEHQFRPRPGGPSGRMARPFESGRSLPPGD